MLIIGAVAVLVAAVIGVQVAWRMTRPASEPLPLSTVATVPLPGHDSRFDYADLDAGAHRLFLAHMGDGTLLELDTRTNTVIATVADLPTVTGVIVVPELHRVFASAAGAGQVVTIDEDTATVLARAPAGSFPDGLAYVPTTGQVWISDEDGGTETVLDARTGQPVATVPLGGEAGNVRYDPAGDRILVDVQTADQIAVIDPHTRTILSRAPVPDCDHDHGLLVADGRAFVGCDGNNKVIVFALPGLTELGALDVGDGPDVLAIDPARQLLYVAAESGEVTTADLRPAAGRVTGRAHLADNAHVVAVDPTTGRAYFPVPDTGAGRPGLVITTPDQEGQP
ncbi:YncE family protein [Modestobacter sp. DSM 44400]|uniref:YncE family protein n=1 Tax=Modestobacter sp. DSM 44400 TaxID=1550230 RepID=UPI001C31B503|nr:YncE family protein [Modestobacter sp. DSM 44400]